MPSTQAAGFAIASPSLTGPQDRLRLLGQVSSSGLAFGQPSRIWSRPPIRRARINRQSTSASTLSCIASQPIEGSISPAIVVVDHGSRRDAANEMLDDVADMVRRRSSGVPVYSAHMELAKPSIADAFAGAVSNGASHIIVVPFFLSPGRHVTTDIPELAKEAAKSYVGVTYDVRPPIGTHPAIAKVIMERAGFVADAVA